MQKTEAVAAMGQSSLLLPAWIKAALSANDRLKLYLSVLQAAAAHADHPDTEPLDLSREMVAAGVEAPWLHDLPAAASRADGTLLIPDLPRLAKRLADDLGVMARPLLDPEGKSGAPRERVKHWLEWLGALSSKYTGGEQLSREQLQSLTSGKRAHGAGDNDSLHLMVMDLHKQLNRLAGTLSSEQIAGAHVWQLQPADRTRVKAFMRGLNRTAPLKFDHPGLDTAATRDGKRLLLQNDIGTNDAHVLVVQVEGTTITLSYSDLHRPRFEFFQKLLAPFGAKWSDTQSKVDAALNEGHAYTFGTARFDCADEPALDAALEGIGSRIVFLIDWNRARKRLLPFVGKGDAIEVLQEVARVDAGHMAWLKAGGEQLIFAAMQAAGEGAFRIGARLDAVLGAADTRAFLVEVLCLASKALLAGQPTALVADETRMLLARRMRQRSSEFDLIEEHAAYCHALAQAVSDGLAHDMTAPARRGGPDAPQNASHGLAARAKRWERQADHLVMRVRDRAQRQPRWQPFARLLELSDDVADALEEAAFLMSLIAEDHRQGWNTEVHQILSRLAQTVLSATQEHIKALALARRFGAGSDAADSDAFLAASWNVLRSERECDELLRAARRGRATGRTAGAPQTAAGDTREACKGVFAVMQRRSFLLSVAGAPVLASCAPAASSAYEDAVRNTWHATEGSLDDADLLKRELVRYATLAPSSHNTQCWKFRIEERAITVLPDLARRCPVVDPDNHHLFVSLGCAAENLVQAALAHGLNGEVRFDPTASGAPRVLLEPTQPRSSPLFAAIPQRQCTRLEFDGKTLAADELRLLETAGTGQGVRVLLLTDKGVTESVLEYLVQGNTRQIEDPAFVTELKTWIRFSDDEAVRTGDGLHGRTSGNPSVPRWLGSAVFPLVFSAKGENDKYARQVRSSAGIAVFVSQADDRAHWVEAGRCYERFALQAAALGIRNAMLNQPVEVGLLRPQFAAFLGLRNERPDLVVRFGRGPMAPRSRRRPVAAVLV